jgi:hypothetical protein
LTRSRASRQITAVFWDCGKIVKLEGNTVTLAGEGRQTQVVKLNSVEGLTVGTRVEIEGYVPEAMTGERAQVIQL